MNVVRKRRLNLKAPPPQLWETQTTHLLICSGLFFTVDNNPLQRFYSKNWKKTTFVLPFLESHFGLIYSTFEVNPISNFIIIINKIINWFNNYSKIKNYLTIGALSRFGLNLKRKMANYFLKGMSADWVCAIWWGGSCLHFWFKFFNFLTARLIFNLISKNETKDTHYLKWFNDFFPDYSKKPSIFIFIFELLQQYMCNNSKSTIW